MVKTDYRGVPRDDPIPRRGSRLPSALCASNSHPTLVTVQNDIEFNYRLDQHGWSEALIRIDGHEHRFLITHVHGSPLEDLGEATLSLLRGRDDAGFAWPDEPGSSIWTFNALPKERHLLRCSVREFKSIPPVPTLEEQVAVSDFVVARDFWVHLVFAELRKIADSLAFKQYQEGREMQQFPWVTFRVIQSELKRA